ILIILIILLLILSFLVSGAEVAFFSLTYKDINMLKTKQHSAAKKIIELLEHPKTLLASLLIAGSFANICLIILSNFAIDHFVQGVDSIAVMYLLKIIIIAFVLVLFGEVLPKVWATQNNLRFAYSAAGLVSFIHSILHSFSRWLVRYSDGLENRMGPNSPNYTLEELDHAIDLTNDNSTSEEGKNILKGIVKFGNITVKQIMRTRMDVSGIEVSTPFNELIAKVEELHYSRLPVYRKSLDEVVGLIHTKDILPYIKEGNSFDWTVLIRPPFFVHENKMVRDLLQQFQSKKIHFAIVVDEFGGTSGIVTLEDIIEEIIGDIKDEFDEEESGNKKLDDNTYIFEGRTMINNICRIINVPIDTFDEVRGESDSLAGLILEQAGDIPSKNDVITCGDFVFTILEVDKNRVLKVKMEIRR
ncbi:MAG TPA: gliding motility-associated protein GldE, partial [Parasegetibacter sp.]